jgi:hypothetical protein
VYLPFGQPVNIERIGIRAGVGRRRSLRRAADRVAGLESDLKLAGENSDVAVAMLDPELDDLFFGWGRARFCVGQHQLLRDGVVDPVGLDVKVMVVTDDKCHFVESTSNRQSYKIFSRI